MSKPTIAVDIDDVIAENAASFVAYSNKRWGTNLTIDEYSDHFAQVWKTDLEETVRRAKEYVSPEVFAQHRHKPEAREVLLELKKNYRLIILTSRLSAVKDATIEWVDRYYGQIFDEILFAGFYDNKKQHMENFDKTKGKLLAKHGADYFIDDQLKHCLSAAEEGIETIVFGDYAWNREPQELPKHVTRCKDWAAVKAYFDERS